MTALIDNGHVILPNEWISLVPLTVGPIERESNIDHMLRREQIQRARDARQKQADENMSAFILALSRQAVARYLEGER